MTPDAVIGKPADHAERGEIVGAAHSVERNCGGSISRSGRACRDHATCIVAIIGPSHACAFGTYVGNSIFGPCRHDPFRDRMAGGDAVVGASAFEHHGFVVGKPCVHQRGACASKAQCERVLGVRQFGARRESVPDDRDAAASLVDEMLYGRTFALLVGEVHGVHGRRLLACVKQHQRAAAVEFGERQIRAQSGGVQDLAVEELPGERIAAQRMFGGVRRILGLFDERRESA